MNAMTWVNDLVLDRVPAHRGEFEVMADRFFAEPEETVRGWALSGI